MPVYACFTYSADLPLGAGNRTITQQMLRDSKICFSYYSGDIPRDTRLCFSYPADASLDARNRNITPPPHDSKLCFSYH